MLQYKPISELMRGCQDHGKGFESVFLKTYLSFRRFLKHNVPSLHPPAPLAALGCRLQKLYSHVWSIGCTTNDLLEHVMQAQSKMIWFLR